VCVREGRGFKVNGRRKKPNDVRSRQAAMLQRVLASGHAEVAVASLPFLARP